MNVVTAIVALVAVRLSARPADAALPYGYHKAEYFSAVVIGIFIAVAALVIFARAYEGFVKPVAFTADPVGLAVSAVASAINGLGLGAAALGRREKSALIADGKHLLTDVVSTLACWWAWWRRRQAGCNSTRSCGARGSPSVVGVAAHPRGVIGLADVLVEQNAR